MSRVAILVNEQNREGHCVFTRLVPYAHVCRTPEELVHALQGYPFEALILSVPDQAPQATLDLIRNVRQTHPSMYIVVWSERLHSSPNTAKFIVDAARAGVNDCVLTETDACSAVQRRIADGMYEAFVLRHVIPATEPLVSPLIQSFITTAIRRGQGTLSVDGIAKSLGTRRQTIARACHKADLPSPLELVSWCRLLLATAILDQTRVNGDQIGPRIFGSPSGFRNTLRRRVGVRPRELQAVGAFQTVLSALTARLQQSKMGS